MTHRTLDEIMADAEQWHQDHPWLSRWHGLKYRLKELWHWRRVPRWTWQRARRGYSDRDLWSLDTYICGVVGAGVEHLRRVSHGHPADLTEDEWDDILTRISGPLLAYSSEKFEDGYTYDEEMARYEAAREAMHLFAEHLGGMWD